MSAASKTLIADSAGRRPLAPAVLSLAGADLLFTVLSTFANSNDRLGIFHAQAASSPALKIKAMIVYEHRVTPTRPWKPKGRKWQVDAGYSE
jgi:hypothetical protein